MTPGVTMLAAMSDHTKHVIDAFAFGGLVTVFLGWLPGVTAVLIAVWTVMRMWETWQKIRINARTLRGEE